MPAVAEDMMAVRKQIVHLLHQQMEALDSPQGLTDQRLTECYERQAQVQELRERLQALANLEIGNTLTSQVRQPSVDNAASI
jgi:hypothetical protein